MEKVKTQENKRKKSEEDKIKIPQQQNTKKIRADKVMDYFRVEWKILLAVTISGLIYNVGLLAGPWFEGQLAECLMNILTGKATFRSMLFLAVTYVSVIGSVQLARYIKRFYVRRFANNVNRRMKTILYRTLVHKSRAELGEEGIGNVITKAISDVDDCVEGMRKFTTEIFDTGIAMCCYIGMLLFYDWKLALISLIFPPISYAIAEKMKRVIQSTNASYKEEMGVLNTVTLDRISNAVTYRVFGCERQRQESYEKTLKDYERSAIHANIWNATLPPIYKVISATGVIFILYLGAKNIVGSGFTAWSIASFTTFLACYTKLSDKSSKAAKLFNAVHKAQISWNRIHPYMERAESAHQEDEKEISASKLARPSENHSEQKSSELKWKNVSFAYPNGKSNIFEQVCFSAKTGQIIGVTGPVACGKSTLGKIMLCEYPYQGEITYSGKEISKMPELLRNQMIGYLGHDVELLDDSVKENILMGDENENVWKWLKVVCMDQEVRNMEKKEDTTIGNGGMRLSGGQSERLSLARVLCHWRPILVLDDPFSALDQTTEEQVFRHLKELSKNRIVFLISHRLRLFPEMDQVIWLDQRQADCSTHEQLMKDNPLYQKLYFDQAQAKEEAQGENNE